MDNRPSNQAKNGVGRSCNGDHLGRKWQPYGMVAELGKKRIGDSAAHRQIMGWIYALFNAKITNAF